MMNKYYYHSLSIQLEDFFDSIYTSENLVNSRAGSIRSIYDTFNTEIRGHLKDFLNSPPKESEGYRIIIGYYDLAEQFRTWYSYLLEMQDSPFSETEKEQIKEERILYSEAQKKAVLPIKRQMQHTYILAKCLGPLSPLPEHLHSCKQEWLNIKIKKDFKQELDAVSGRESGDLARLRHLCDKFTSGLLSSESPILNKKITELFEYCLDKGEEEQAAFVKEKLEGLLEEAIKESRALLKKEVDEIINRPESQEEIKEVSDFSLITIYDLAASPFNHHGSSLALCHSQSSHLWVARILNEAYGYQYFLGEEEKIKVKEFTLRGHLAGSPQKMRMDPEDLHGALYTDKNMLFFSFKPERAVHLQQFRQWFFPDFLAALFFPSPYGLLRVRILMKFFVEDPYVNFDAQTSSLYFLEELKNLSIKGAIDRPKAYPRLAQTLRYPLPDPKDDCWPELDLLVKIALPRLIADLEDSDMETFLKDNSGEAQDFIQEICKDSLWQVLSNEINDLGGEWIANISYTSRYFKEEFALQLEKLGLPRETAQKLDIGKTTNFSFIFRFIRQTQKGDRGLITLINIILDIIQKQYPVRFIPNKKTDQDSKDFRLQNRENWEKLLEIEKPCLFFYRGAPVPCQLTRESLFEWDGEKTNEGAIHQNRLGTKLLSDIRHMEIHSSGHIEDINKLSSGPKERIKAIDKGIPLKKILEYFQNAGGPEERTPDTLEGLMHALIYFRQENPQAQEVPLCTAIIEAIRAQKNFEIHSLGDQKERPPKKTLLELLNKALQEKELHQPQLLPDEFNSLLDSWKKLSYQSEELLQLAKDIQEEVIEIDPAKPKKVKAYELEEELYSEAQKAKIVTFLTKAFYLDDRFFIQNNRLRLIIYLLYWAVELSNGTLNFGVGIANKNTES